MLYSVDTELKYVRGDLGSFGQPGEENWFVRNVDGAEELYCLGKFASTDPDDDGKWICATKSFVESNAFVEVV